MEIKEKVKISKNNPSIQRIPEKCIDCGVCLNTCNNLIGFDRTYEPPFEPYCINCGQCVLACPMGALTEKYDYKTVLNLVKDSGKLVSISVAPAVRTSLGEELGLPLGEDLEDILPSILKAIGFDYVFDVTFGADVTVMEEASELLYRIKTGSNLPMFTSCCPSWVKYAHLFHREIIDDISTTKSPIGIQSTLIKTYFKEMNAIEEDIVSVVVAPCTAKKYEIIDTDTDYSITTRELAMMIKECDIDIKNLRRSSFDSLLGHGSHCARMFGRSGGVMEAALTTAYYLMTGKRPPEDMFHLEIASPITEASYKMGDKIINVAVVSGIKNVKEVLKNKDKYDFIEVMNCVGGCIAGGGQPYSARSDTEIRRLARTESLNTSNGAVKYSYENDSLKELYSSYLISPLSAKAEDLLHIKRN